MMKRFPIFHLLTISLSFERYLMVSYMVLSYLWPKISLEKSKLILISEVAI